MLLLNNVGFLRENKTIFSRTTFSAREGEVVAVLGMNGSGKTTLLRIIAGLLQPTTGSITWDGRTLETLGENYKKSIIYIGHSSSFKSDLTPYENLRTALSLSGIKPDLDRIKTSLEKVGLNSYQNLPSSHLSAGQKQRLALARLNSQDAKLWILDEPSTALDNAGLDLLEDLITQHLGGGGIAVVASHSQLKVRAKEIHVIKLSKKESSCSVY